VLPRGVASVPFPGNSGFAPISLSAAGKGAGPLRIVVDLNRCLGYAQCVPLAPEVLQLHGEEALAYDPNPDDSQRQRVARAAASCPVQAIIVELDPPADRTTM
jgi:ferredoxin